MVSNHTGNEYDNGCFASYVMFKLGKVASAIEMITLELMETLQRHGQKKHNQALGPVGCLAANSKYRVLPPLSTNNRGTVSFEPYINRHNRTALNPHACTFLLFFLKQLFLD